MQECIFTEVLGKIIKKHRMEQKKSVYKICAECGVPKTTWHNIEDNKTKDIYFTNLWKIAEGLDILPEDLIRELRQELGEDFSLSGLK